MRDWPLLAIDRSDATGCLATLCQRRQPPKAGAVGQRLQRVAGQPSWTIKINGRFPSPQLRSSQRSDPSENEVDIETDSSPFTRGFSPPPTPGEEVWLVGEWRSSGERKHYLS